MAKLIIISGAEATGKSTIRDELANRLKVKYLSKDIIKETMFDTQTVSTWNFSWYESRAKDELFRQINERLKKGESLIIEANFRHKDKNRLKRIVDDDLRIYEIFCFAKGFTIFKRFVARNERGLRHKGHHDRRWYLSVFITSICGILRIKWLYGPMKLSDKLLYLNTTNLAKIDYGQIGTFINQSS